jgi:hypothetical protein
MMMRKRGRPRKHEWIELKDLDNNYSPEAQYLKWAGVNMRAREISEDFQLSISSLYRHRTAHTVPPPTPPRTLEEEKSKLRKLWERYNALKGTLTPENQKAWLIRLQMQLDLVKELQKENFIS